MSNTDILLPAQQECGFDTSCTHTPTPPYPYMRYVLWEECERMRATYNEHNRNDIEAIYKKIDAVWDNFNAGNAILCNDIKEVNKTMLETHKQINYILFGVFCSTVVAVVGLYVMFMK